MIVDTSALVAIILQEPDATGLGRLLAAADVRRMSAASYVELCAVIDGRRDQVGSAKVDRLIRKLGIELVPFTESQARIARAAYVQYGRGSGHPARLNMGDCFAYALAEDLNEPLLFKGRDFARTDIEIVTTADPRKRLSELVAAYSASTGTG